jgi:hypothetical protein
MHHDSGAPAFDNIDDLLADKIVRHSRTHSEQTEKPETTAENQPEEETVDTSKKSTSSITGFSLVFALIILILLFFVYRLSVRTSTK